VQQEILAASPQANVRIYAVWFNMLPNDSRGKFPTDLLTDSRVTQFWDENHLVGTAFAPLADWHKGVLWDAYFLYGPDATWPALPASPSRSDSPGERSSPPQESAGEDNGATAKRPLPKPASWGRTIFSMRDQLQQDFERMKTQ
jgi:hypothetical protein